MDDREKKLRELEQIRFLVEKNTKVETIFAEGKAKTGRPKKKDNVPVLRGMFCVIAVKIRAEGYYSTYILGEAVGINHSSVQYWLRNFEDVIPYYPELEYVYKQTLQEAEAFAKSIILLTPKEIDKDAREVIKMMSYENREREAVREKIESENRKPRRAMPQTTGSSRERDPGQNLSAPGR